MTFDEAVAVVKADWPDYELAPYGYETDADYLVLLLPLTAGGRIAAVAKSNGEVRWINENADEYIQDRPVGDWTARE